MTTARDLITAALRKIHAIGRGQSLNADDGMAALLSMNAMLSSWGVGGGLLYANVIESFPLTGAASYTIKPSGNFNTVSPIKINSVTIANDSYDSTLNQLDTNGYAGVTDKSTQGESEAFYYERGTNPTIYLYPVPDASYSLTIYSQKPLGEFTDLNTVYDMPLEYQRAIINNLAVELCPDYEKEASQTLQYLARESKENIIKANSMNKQNLMENGLVSSGGHFDILRGRYS